MSSIPGTYARVESLTKEMRAFVATARTKLDKAVTVLDEVDAAVAKEDFAEVASALVKAAVILESLGEGTHA